MRKKQLAEILVHRACPVIQGHLAVAQAQALQILDPFLRRNKRHERRSTFRNGMSKLYGKSMSVPRRAGGRVRVSARGEDNGVPSYNAPVHCQSASPAVCDVYALYTGIEVYLDSEPFHGALQGVYHVARPVRNRKNSSASLGFQRTSLVLKKLTNHIIVKRIHRTVQKIRVCHDISEKVLRLAGVREVAAPFSRDKKFFAEPLVFFKKTYLVPALSRRDGSHHSRCAAARH